MTEKRFNYEGAKVFDDGEFLCCTLSVWVKQLVDLLNELHEENKELKKRDDLVSDCLRDEGSITLEKYDEIVDYLYKEWKKKRDLNDRE